MKCLIAADIHYSLKQFDWLLSVAADFDLVILAGDLLEISSSVDRRAQIVVVSTYLEELAKLTRVAVCSGNHDLDARSAAGELTASWLQDLTRLGITVDFGSLTLGTTLITVCPWWDGPETCAEIGRQLAEDALKPHERWIWVYHAPPSDSPTSWGGKRSYGDQELLNWIGQYKPDLVVSGHVHQSPFVPDGAWCDLVGQTWVFNAGYQIGPTPAHIICDLSAAEAAWFSLAGAELMTLGVGPMTAARTMTSLPDWLRAGDPDGQA